MRAISQPGGAGSRSLAADAMVMRATAAATRGDRLMAQGIDVWRSECHPTTRVFAGELRGERFALASPSVSFPRPRPL